MVNRQSKFILTLLYVFSGFWLYSNFPENTFNTYPIYLNHEKKTPDTNLNITMQAFKKYSMYVEVELPDNEKNREIGMFSVDVGLANNNIHTKERRTYLLEYYSNIIRNIRDVSWSPMYIFFNPQYRQKLVQNYYDSIELQSSYTNLNIKLHENKLQYYNIFLVIKKDNQNYGDKIMYYIAIVFYAILTVAISMIWIMYSDNDNQIFQSF